MTFAHRAEALASHAEAAARILSANNVSAERGPWELDLHGLHPSEAVAALDERLAGAWHGIGLRILESALPVLNGPSDAELIAQFGICCTCRQRLRTPASEPESLGSGCQHHSQSKPRMAI